MRRRPDDLLAALFIALLLAAYFLYFIHTELVDLGRPSIWSGFDLESYFLPRFWFGARSMLHGSVPLWNPFEYGGIPFLATGQPSVFYPPTMLIFGLLPREAAHWTFLILHYAFAAWTMFYFLRRAGFGAPSVLLGVAAWLFSVPLLQSNYHPPRVAHLSWTPLVFALVERVGAGNRRAFVTLALVVAIQLLCGYPEFAMDESLLVAIYATTCWLIGTWKAPPWTSLVRIGAAFLLGVLAAAVQLVPLGELARLSSRETLVQPGPFAFPREIGLGAVLLTLPAALGFTVLGAFPKRGRPALVGFLFCVVVYEYGWKLLRILPGFSFVRFPLVWLYLRTFYMAWLTAAGAEEIFAAAGSARRTRVFTFALVGSAVVLVATHALGLQWAARSPNDLATRISLSVPNGAAAALGIAGVTAFAALAVVALRRAVHPAAWMGAVALVVLAQLAAFPFGAKTAPFHPPAPKGLAAAYQAEHRPLDGRALAADDILYGYEVTDRIPSPLGVEQSFLPTRQRKIVDKLGFISMFGRLDWTAVARAKGYLDAMDVELAVVPSVVANGLVASGFVEAARSETDAYLTNPNRMGHAWVNYAVRTARTRDQALGYFMGDRFDPHREVVLEAPTRRAYPEPGPSTAKATAPITEHRVSDTKASWDVELAQPGIFVASESAYPGWEATVDGQSAKWFTADYVLRGVELDAGRHVVSFEYHPLSFRIGAWSSFLGFALIAAVGLRRVASKDTAPASS
ncbi:MAG TPA: YfhO family protein [Polyangiaceae bacterium]|nr:YfhO family protein [Polyangiaceae bacterium]